MKGPDHSRRILASEVSADRYWPKVNKSNEGCWTWTAGRHKAGLRYGVFALTKKWQAQAHRAAYALAYGEAPALRCVLHRCDNPICVRPDHLFLGTSADNNKDRAKKGRNGSNNNTWTRGERNGAAKLSQVAVTEIRRAYAAHELNQYELATKFGVARSTIGWIVRGQCWKELELAVA